MKHLILMLLIVYILLEGGCSNHYLGFGETISN